MSYLSPLYYPDYFFNNIDINNKLEHHLRNRRKLLGQLVAILQTSRSVLLSIVCKPKEKKKKLTQVLLVLKDILRELVSSFNKA